MHLRRGLLGPRLRAGSRLPQVGGARLRLPHGRLQVTQPPALLLRHVALGLALRGHGQAETENRVHVEVAPTEPSERLSSACFYLGPAAITGIHTRNRAALERLQVVATFKLRHKTGRRHPLPTLSYLLIQR